MIRKRKGGKEKEMIWIPGEEQVVVGTAEMMTVLEEEEVVEEGGEVVGVIEEETA